MNTQQHSATPLAAARSLFGLPYQDLDTTTYSVPELLSLAEQQLHMMRVEAENLHDLVNQVIHLGEEEHSPVVAVAGVLAIAMQSVDHRTHACLEVVSGLRKALATPKN